MSHSPSRRARDDLQVEDFGDELVVLDPDTGDVHHLDGPATLVWRLIDGRRDIAQITRALGQAVGAQPAALEGDVEATVRHFDLLHLLDDDAPPEGRR